jgi:dTDP-4-amino-4,6-dideoxygalactose transaminase
MTELQAALGISQMNRIVEFVQRRQILARQYDVYFSKSPLILTPWQDPSSKSSYHLYVIRLKNGESKKSHLEVFNYLRENKIGVNLHYIPVHIQPYYSKMGFLPEDFPNAMDYYREAISLPLFSGMNDDQQNEVVQRLNEALL